METESTERCDRCGRAGEGEHLCTHCGHDNSRGEACQECGRPTVWASQICTACLGVGFPHRGKTAAQRIIGG